MSTLTQEIIHHEQEENHSSTRKNISDYNDYRLNDYKNPSLPPVIGSYTDNTNRNLLDYRLSVDCAMAIGASITSLEEPSRPPLDSWTVFKSNTSYIKVYKSETRFFLVIFQPPSDSACKCYLYFLLDLKSDLEIDHIFFHSDQDVFYKTSKT